jgi:hypothetical protein
MRVEKDVPVKENTCVSSYHLPVSIQHRLVNEIRKPFDYPYIAVKKVSNGVTSAVEVVCCLIAGGVADEKPHHPKVSSSFLI